MTLDETIKQQAAYYGMTVEEFAEWSARMADQQELEDKQL